MRYAQIAYFHAFGTFNFLFRDSDTKLKIHCFSQLVLITKKTFQFFEVIPEVLQNNEWMYDTTNRGSIRLPLLHSEYDTECALEATKNKEVETVKLDKAWNVLNDPENDTARHGCKQIQGCVLPCEHCSLTSTLCSSI
jgi:hypothetical protein